MALREFTDAEGRAWQVWETVPETPREEWAFEQNARLLADAARSRISDQGETASLSGGRFSEGREAGWLTFMADTQKRRLSPIPPNWADATDAELAAHLARAEPVHLSEAAARVLVHDPTTKRPEDRPTP